MAINRLRVAWTGGPGGPGVSTFYFLDAVAAISPMQTLLNEVLSATPVAIQAQIETTGDVVDETNGAISGTWSTAAVANIQGGGVGAYASPIGSSVRWRTVGIVGNRRVSGRTYFVPLLTSWYDTTGTLNDTFRASLQTKCQNLVDVVPGNLVVWSRPAAARPAWTDVHGKLHPAKAAVTGSKHAVTVATVADKVAIMSSRRD